MSRRNLFLFAGLGLVLAAGSGVGQTPDIHEPVPNLKPPVSPSDLIVLPTNPAAKRRIEAARDYIKSADWGEVVHLLQATLDASEESFLELPGSRGAGSKSRVWVSTRREAELLLRSLPGPGLAFYQLTYDGAARKMLADASQLQDPVALAEVARRYRFTNPGTEALSQLASHYLERGRPDLAAVCYRKLVDFPGPAKLPALTLFKATLAFQGSGDTVRREQFWRLLQQHTKDDGFPLGKLTLKPEELRREIDRWLPSAGKTTDWLLERGNPERLLAMPISSPSLATRWQAPLTEQKTVRDLLEPPGSVPIEKVTLPTTTPLSVDGRLILRIPAGIEARDQATGKLLWRTPLPLSLESILANPGRKVQLEHWLRLYDNAQHLLTNNSVLSTLSSDGRLIYAVDDLPVPPNPTQIMEMQAGVKKHYFSTLKDAIYHNRLVALDATTGTVAWSVGGREKTVPAALRDAYFLGPPLPLGQQIYVVVQRGQDIDLVCLDPTKGEVVWAQHLVNAQHNPLLDISQRMQAIPLAARDGLLICPTRGGAIVAIDLLSRSLAWAHTYPSTSPFAPGGEEGPDPPVMGQQELTGPATIMIPTGERVLVSSSDSASLRCLRLADGKLLWETARGENDLFLATVSKERVLIVNQSGCRALSLATGQQLWEYAIPSPPAGQGVLSEKPEEPPLYYLPLRSGVLLALNLEYPQQSVPITSSNKTQLGNLLALEDGLWSQTPCGIQAFSSSTLERAKLDRELKMDPTNPKYLLRRARLSLERGDLSAANADLRRLLQAASDARTNQIRALQSEILTRMLAKDFATAAPLAEAFLAESSRSTTILALLGQGYQSRGQGTKALAAYRRLHDEGMTGPLLTLPDRLNLQQRADVWSRKLVADLFRTASDVQRQELRARFAKDWQTLASAPTRQMTTYLNLFDKISAQDWPALAEARQTWINKLGETTERGEIQPALHRLLLVEQTTESNVLRAHALDARARLLTTAGLSEDALEAYRQLKRFYPGQQLADGRTGTEACDEADHDRRLLSCRAESTPSAWQGRSLRFQEMFGSFSPRPSMNLLPGATADEGENWYNPSQAHHQPPFGMRWQQFQVDPRAARLRVPGRKGEELWSLALPQAITQVEAQSSAYCLLDHLAIVSLGHHILAVDLVQRRIRWTYDVIDPQVDLANSTINSYLGLTVLMKKTTGEATILGLVGPVDLSILLVKTAAGLISLDPLTGQPCWLRTDVPNGINIKGDRNTLLLLEGDPGNGGDTASIPLRNLRALRADDGTSLPIPKPQSLLAGCHGIHDSCLLIVTPDKGGIEMRWYDVGTGKDLWKERFPLRSSLLSSTVPGLTGVVSPDGNVSLVDMQALREGRISGLPSRLKIDRKHLPDLRGSTLMLDANHVYLALNHTLPGRGAPVDNQNPHFQGDLTNNILLDGSLYAFNRASGARSWVLPVSRQYLMLRHFQEAPILCCSSQTVTQLKNTSQQVVHITTQLIDKRSGKTIYHRYWENIGVEQYTTFNLDPVSGVIELIAPRFKIRLAPEPNKEISLPRKKVS